jgi:predicted RNase H-like HicB family nuclease
MNLKSSSNYTKLKLKIKYFEKDGMLFAEIIDMPGCKAKGRTYEELEKNIQIAITRWLEVYRNSTEVETNESKR